MLIVIVIISLLTAALIGVFQQVRNSAWKQKARDSARQIAVAWNIKLLDDHTFPPANSVYQPTAVTPLTFQTSVSNMVLLNSTKIYLEQNALQRSTNPSDSKTAGMRDHWGNLFYVQLDTSYSGIVNDPIDPSKTISANVIVWSTGPNPANPASSFCVASP